MAFVTTNEKDPSINPFNLLADHQPSSNIDVEMVADSQLPAYHVVLGDEIPRTPNASKLHSDGILPSSPTERVIQVQRTQLEPSEAPPRSKRPRTTGKVGYSNSFYGHPTTKEEALIQAKISIEQAITLTNNQFEKESIKELLNLTSDLMQGKPLRRALDSITQSAQELERIARSLNASKMGTTIQNSRESSASTRLQGSRFAPTPPTPNQQLYNEMEQVRATPAWQQAQPTKNTPKPRQSLRLPSAKLQFKERRLILTKTKNQGFSNLTPLQLRNTVNSAIKKTIIQSISTTIKGNLVLLTTDDLKAAELLENEDMLHKFIQFDTALLDEAQYKVAIHGIPHTELRTFENPLKILEEEFKTFNKEVQLASKIQWLSRREKREDPNTFKVSIVVAFKQLSQAKHLIRHGAHLLGQKLRVEEVLSAPPFHQCKNCHKFGKHYASDCKMPAICGLCAGDHPTKQHRCEECNIAGKECEHTKLSCSNCNQQHSSDDKSCTSRPNLRPILQ